MNERVGRAASRASFAVLWLVVAIVIALGAAGLVTALDHRPGTPGRPELTWAGDAAASATHRDAVDEVEAIAALVDDLGLQGRGAIAALTAREFEILETAVATGGGLVVAIRDQADDLRSRLDGVRGVGAAADFILSRETQERHETLVAAIEATDGLAFAWARLTAGALTATRLASLLDAHDESVTAAIEAGRAGRFDDAFARIDAATAALDEAAELGDRLRATVDVATLDEWLRRNREYDDALRGLYEASAASPDRVTPEIRAALGAEAEARAALPRTTNGLTIVMSDIAAGGLNQAVVAVQGARGRLAAALAALRDETREGAASRGGAG